MIHEGKGGERRRESERMNAPRVVFYQVQHIGVFTLPRPLLPFSFFLPVSILHVLTVLRSQALPCILSASTT